MLNMKAKFASAFFVGILASLPLSTVFDGAARAADDCLSEPNGATPQGKHWFYRIERGTGRHCWYLRGEDEQPARAAAPESTPTAKAPSRSADLIASSSIADARAELPGRTPVAQDAVNAPAGAAPPAADSTSTVPPSTTAQAAASSPWPDPSSAVPKLGPPPKTTAATSDEQTNATAAPTPAPAPPPPAQAAMPMDRNMGSLQKLLLVAFGALLLSGLTGSAVYRLAGARRRARMRRDRWPARKPVVRELIAEAPTPPWVPPAIETTAPPHDLARPSIEFDRPDPNERVERIEDYLARLTRQLEAEMQAPRAERRRAAG